MRQQTVPDSNYVVTLKTRWLPTPYHAVQSSVRRVRRRFVAAGCGCHLRADGSVHPTAAITLSVALNEASDCQAEISLYPTASRLLLLTGCTSDASTIALILNGDLEAAVDAALPLAKMR